MPSLTFNLTEGGGYATPIFLDRDEDDEDVPFKDTPQGTGRIFIDLTEDTETSDDAQKAKRHKTHSLATVESLTLTSNAKAEKRAIILEQRLVVNLATNRNNASVLQITKARTQLDILLGD